MHTVKWLQVWLFNTNSSIQDYAFICTQLNGSNYQDVIPIIQFRYTVKWFQVFHTNSYICTQLNGSRYSYVIPIIQFRHTVKQLLQFNINNSIQHYSFICIHLNSSKYYYLTLIIQFNISHIVKWSNSSIWPIDGILKDTTTLVQSGPGCNGNEGALHIPKRSRTEASPSDGIVS